MIQIVSENPFFIVLFKPHGVSVHNQSPSLLEYVKTHQKPEHFVNRLDAETSGLVVIAQNQSLHEPLQQSLHAGIKKYRALLCGVLQTDAIWNWPISDKAEGHKNPQGEKANQKESLTEVKVVRSSKYFTEVEIILKTGRQHQIRKHSLLAKHPLLGDNRYGNEKYNTKMSTLYKDSRMQLEAESLNFKFQDENYSFQQKSLELDKFFV